MQTPTLQLLGAGEGQAEESLELGRVFCRCISANEHNRGWKFYIKHGYVTLSELMQWVLHVKCNTSGYGRRTL